MDNIKHLFGYFFGRPSLQIQLLDGGIYDIFIPFGPLVGLGSSVDILKMTGEKIYKTSSEYKLIQAMGDYFQSYFSTIFINPFNEFVDSQTNLFKFLRSEAQIHLDVLYKNNKISLKEMKYLETRIFLYLEQGCFHYKTDHSTSVRGSIDSFLESHHNHFRLFLNDISHPDGGDFFIDIYQDDLMEIDFMSFPNLDELYTFDSNFYTKLKDSYLEQQVVEVSEVINDLILSKKLTEGKSRIYLLEGYEDKGYLLVNNMENSDRHRWVPQTFDNRLPTYTTRLPFVELDFTKSGTQTYEESLYKLWHFVTIIESSNYALLITKSDNIPTLSKLRGMPMTATFDEIVCILNKDGFIKINEFNSKEVRAQTISHANCYQVIINSYSYNGKAYDLFSQKLKDAHKYHFAHSEYWLKTSYLRDYIYLDKDAYARYIKRDVLELN